MKKSIFTVASVLMIAASTFTSCDTPKDDVVNAQENVADAQKNLDEATDDYIAEIESFRTETNEKIAANDRSIAVLKANVAEKNAATKSAYWSKIAELEKRNGELKIRMADYKADGKDNWGTFKSEFNHDMDGLGSAFKDVTVKNAE
jgi:chromosome segregation ATPase